MRSDAHSLWLPLLAAALSFGLAESVSAVTMDWTYLGNPGNAAGTYGHDSVPYTYNIGTYEVTNAQYAEFLNANAASDPHQLYNPNMCCNFGGTNRDFNPSSGIDAYNSFFDAMRFAKEIV